MKTTKIIPAAPHPYLLEGKFDKYVDECILSIHNFRKRESYGAESMMYREVVVTLHLKIHDWDRCIEFCKEWLSRIPPLSEQFNAGAYFPNYYCSRSLYEKGDFVEAEKYARQAIDASRRIEDDDFLVKSVTLYSWLLAQQGRFDDAVKEIETIQNRVISSPLYGHLFTTLACIYRKEGKFNLALESVNQAMAELANKRPKIQVNAYLEKAEILIDLYGDGKLAEASEASDVADSLLDDPTDRRRQNLEKIRARIQELSSNAQ